MMKYGTFELMRIWWKSKHKIDAVMGLDVRETWDGVNVFCIWDGYSSLTARQQNAVDWMICVIISKTWILPNMVNGTLQMWLMILRDCLSLSRWIKSNHKGPHKRDAERSVRKCDNWSQGSESEKDLRMLYWWPWMQVASRDWKRQGNILL